MNNKKISCSIFVKNNQDSRLLKTLLSRYKMLNIDAIIHNAAEATELLQDASETLLFIDFDSVDILKHIQKPAFIVGVGPKTNAIKMRKLLNSGMFDFIFLPISEENITILMSKLFKILKIQTYSYNESVPMASENMLVYKGRDVIQQNVVGLNHRYIFLISGRKNHPFKLIFSDIQYISKVGNHICIHFDNADNQYFKITLKYCQERLPANLFFKINQSTIINIDKIKKLEQPNTIVIGDDSLKVARSYKKQLKQRICGLK